MPTIPLEPEQLDVVEEALNVQFRDRAVLLLALTHQSYANEHPDDPPVSNERLEFLGDSIVGMVIADLMFTGAPDLPEGDLTVRRSQVIRRETLADAARNIGLGEWLVMGKGEAASGGNERASILADTFEAVVGAVYTDRGYRKARVFVNSWLGEYVEEALRTGTRKDPKSLLQEYLQAKGIKPPRYQLVSESGSESELIFVMEVVIDSKSVASGSGSRKNDAESEAAKRALDLLKTNQVPDL